MRVPILRGALRGWWWSLNSGGKLGRVLSGSYEPVQTELFERWVVPGSQVVDLGAHVGYYTLLSARLAGESGRVIALEPNPRNARHLREHVRMNGLRNVDVCEAAVSDEEGEAQFTFGRGSGTGHLARQHDRASGVTVAVTTVDAFCSAGTCSPSVLKLDVEGGELKALRGAAATIASHRPVIFLSTHGPRLRSDCLDLLAAAGYRAVPIDGATVETASDLLCLPDDR